jgi:PiT family inorganic phosphate transporter
MAGRIAGTVRRPGWGALVRSNRYHHVVPPTAQIEVRCATVEAVTLSLVIVVALALVFDYINGFHDTANAIATSVATRALRPAVAIGMAASFNFIGAFFGTAVAKTIGSGLVDDASTTQAVVAAALLGAIAWNLLTWWWGLPSSSSHALIGGLIGATVIAAGTGALKIEGILNKVVIPMVTSPIIGFSLAFVFMLSLYWIFRNQQRKPMARVFRRLQILSAGYMAFSHGTNDAQKTMGIITLALVAAGGIDNGWVSLDANGQANIPTWVIIAAATAISLGTAVGGWRIMRTMGHRVVELEPVHGFAAETTAATVLLGTAHFGMPVSTTHVISSSIMGVGSSKGPRGVRWGVARNILIAWIVTIPATAVTAAVAWLIIHNLFVS